MSGDDIQSASRPFGRDHKALEAVQRFRYGLGDLKQRWDNRIILERCSLAELYLNGRIEIVLHGDLTIAAEQYTWACRVKLDDKILNEAPGGPHIDGLNLGGQDGRNEKVVLVVLVEGVKI